MMKRTIYALILFALPVALFAVEISRNEMITLKESPVYALASHYSQIIKIIPEAVRGQVFERSADPQMIDIPQIT